MKIILHGVLRERFGREFEIKTDVPADAIEGLSRQLPDFPREMRIDVVGFTTEEQLRSVTDADEIHLMPSMHGGGGKWTAIIIGIALIATAILLPVLAPGAAGLFFAGTSIGMTTGMMFMVGASMVLMGVSQLFMKAPTVDKDADPPASKYFGVNKNTAAIGTLITMAWGRIKLGGHWLSIQVDSNNLVTTSFPVTTS